MTKLLALVTALSLSALSGAALAATPASVGHQANASPAAAAATQTHETKAVHHRRHHRAAAAHEEMTSPQAKPAAHSSNP